MKRLIIILGVLIGTVWPVAAASAVAPQTLSSVPLIRGAAPYAFTVSSSFTAGAPLLFSNCVTFADVAGTITQQLVSVNVQIGVGYSTTATWYTAAVTDPTRGIFSCLTQIPTSTSQSVYWQCKLTDVNTNIYYYPIQQLAIIQPLP